MFLRRHSLSLKSPSITIITHDCVYRDPIRTHAKTTGLTSRRMQAFPTKQNKTLLGPVQGPNPHIHLPTPHPPLARYIHTSFLDT